jgi:lysophospholipase L1-like esterase
MQEDFAPASVINRGFGGSTIREVIHYSDRILFPYQPKVVVLYVGNDVWGDPAEPTTEQLFNYFKLFELTLHRHLPNTMLNFVSMRPSPEKRKLLEKQNAICNLLQQYVQKTPETNFIDIRPVMYDNSGHLRNDIFIADSLHLNNTGNQLITGIIKPILIKQLDKKK